MDDTCSLLQSDELLILESLFPDCIHQESSDTLRIDLPIVFEEEHTLALTENDVGGEGSGSSASMTRSVESTESIATTTLPTLRIRLDLPSIYPIQTSPIISSLRSIHPTTLAGISATLPIQIISLITEKLNDLWEEGKANSGTGEGEGILWGWLDWVGRGEWIEALDKEKRQIQYSTVGVGDSSRRKTRSAGKDVIRYRYPVPPPYTPSSLHSLILSTTTASLRSAFDSTTFLCGICFGNFKGRDCISMGEWECLEPSGADGTIDVDNEEDRQGHVFCLDCLRDCWELAIREGGIERVGCPGVECTKRRVIGDRAGGVNVGDQVVREGQSKDGSRITDDLVERVVGMELKDRWVWLVEKRRVEKDATYITCPMAHCQAPVPAPSRPTLSSQPRKSSHIYHLTSSSPSSAVNPADAPQGPLTEQENKERRERIKREEEEKVRKEERERQREEDRWDRYRDCGKCGFSFCRYCLQTWHGIHLPCPMPATFKFLHAYLALDPTSPERLVMERRYGVKQLARMVADWEEQEGNRKWLEENSRVCPGCACRVEKSQGCNHMTCSKCSAHFCYRCSSPLKPADPYAHYRQPGTSCFERLFDIEEIHRFEREMAGGGGDIGWEVFGHI